MCDVKHSPRSLFAVISCSLVAVLTDKRGEGKGRKRENE